MKCFIATCVAVLASVTGTSARGDVKLPPVISNNMVLQADMPAPLWGTADVGEAVAVEFNGQKKTATAAPDGKWSMKLDPVKAGGPFELKIGGKTITNVLVGEVWHAGGQSNMHYTMAAAAGYKEVEKEAKPQRDSDDPAAKAEYAWAKKNNEKAVAEAQAAIAGANNPNIRFFERAGWVIMSPKTAGPQAAVAFYFATDLATQLKEPVGIINTSVAGAACQEFMSPESLKADAELAQMVAKHDSQGPASGHWPAVSAVIPYGVKGAIWYQGEGNRDFPVTYQKLFPALIKDWREHAGQGDFPFLFVQLANYGGRTTKITEGKDVALREAQFKSLAVPNTAMAVAIDVGFAGNVHYPDKKPVGDRLALAARALAYKEKIEYSGPLFDSAQFTGGKAIVSFTHIGGGLAAKSDGALTGYLLAGADHKWVRATASIAGNTVVVQSDQVANPTAVRYAFEKNPECNLINKEGLPASPFRSDNWVSFATKDGG